MPRFQQLEIFFLNPKSDPQQLCDTRQDTPLCAPVPHLGNGAKIINNIHISWVW